MNKTKGWILIIFTSLLLTVFLLFFIIIIAGIINHPEKPFNLPNPIIPAIGFIVVISLLMLGFTNGLKMVRKKRKRIISIYSKPLNIELKGKIEFANYRNLLIRNSIKKTNIFIFFGFSTLLLLATINNPGNTLSTNLPLLAILLAVVLFTPILTLSQAKKLYDSNKIFQEPLEYHITNDSIQIKGITVNSTLKWSHFFQIKETKEFFMFFHGENVATLVEKQMFNSENLTQFYEFINSLDLKFDK
jgi:hypothetical protein